MATIIGGIATTHVPVIGNAIAKNLQNEPYWKPFFDGFKSAHAWLSVNQPDVVVVVYKPWAQFLPRQDAHVCGRGCRRISARR